MNCKNCSFFINQDDNYCPSCGGKVIRNRLTFKNLIEHFSEQFLNYDNKFLQTFIHLFTKPEVVIDGYINGTRKKYVNPISFFAINLTISGLYIFISLKYFAESMDFSSLYENEIQQKITQEISQFTVEYNSIIYFLLIPVIALISKIVFYNKSFNIIEHIVIYLYSFSFWSLLTIVINLIILLAFPSIFMWTSLITFALMLVYHGYILKRIFNLNTSALLIKTLIFLPLFFTFYIIASIFVFVIMFLIGDYSLQDFAPKK